MEFKAVVRDDYELVRQFLSEVGWQDRVSDPERFTKMMENTSRSVVAFDGSRIVGFARAVSDEVSNGYISMVAVAADRRGHGIGRELVRRLIKDDVGNNMGLTCRSWEQRLLEETGLSILDYCDGTNPILTASGE